MTLSGVAYASALVVAAVFAVAAIAKLRAPNATADAFAAQGLPHPRSLARVVPVAELVIAAALVVAPMVGGVLAALTMIIFTVVLLDRRRHAPQAPCGCFGEQRSHVSTGADVVANCFLFAGSVLAVFAPAPVRPTVADLALVLMAFAADIAVQAAIRSRHPVPGG